MASAPKGPWNHLPTELWQLVFDLSDQKELAAISLVSKRLHTQVEPSLYANFSWVPHVNQQLPSISKLGGRDVSEYTKTRRKRRTRGLGPHGPPPFLLLRTILNRPELTRYIKDVKVLAPMRQDGLFWDGFEAREGGLSKEETALCERAIRRMEHVSRARWEVGLRIGSLEIAIALLLSRLCQIRSIEIRIRGGSMVSSALFEALGGPSTMCRLQSIKSVAVSIDQNDYGDPVFDRYGGNPFDIDHQMKALMSLPRLEKLSVNCFAPDTIFWPSTLPLAHGLKTLYLNYSDLNEETLRKTLLATPVLEDLECELVYDRSMGEYCDGEKLNAALSLVSDTLRRLVLVIDILYPNETDDGDGLWNVVRPTGSMKNFKQLRFLIFPLITVVEFTPEPSDLQNILPDNLEVMDLKWYPPFPDGSRRRAANRAIKAYHEIKPALGGIYTIFH
ncbi:hypothetical protein G7Y89_g9361 [Cudoniella acicularis]|uniref:F-box domain-containing protein n=1 Tax=Cudoniella acicularis TaxID=354080 RepID=A0A8H4RET5_9HELO|nr:hypothetical protein G7Y89_g9361 [Cudoniella acicularis]